MTFPGGPNQAVQTPQVAPSSSNPLGSTPEQEQDALTSITQMLTGSQMLKDQPGVVYALQRSQASPQDAHAIDQFMQGMDLEKQVRLAGASGHKIILDSGQTARLDALGVNYSGVQYTQQDALKDAATYAEQQNPGISVKRDASGVPMLDQGGNLQVEKAPKKKQSGWMRVVHDLKNWTYTDTIKPALGGMNKALNVANYNVSTMFGLEVPDNLANQDMRAQGYDPSSVWSTLAYEASGHAHGAGLKGVVKQYGQPAVSDAMQFADDPKAYERQIFNDPANFTKNADGQPVPTQQGQALLDKLQSPDFTNLVRKLGAQNATWGNVVANDLNIDPVKHSTTYAVTSGVANLVASFMVDPTLVLGKAAKIYKISQVGLDSILDSTAAAKILDAEQSTGLIAQQVQRRTQGFIDLTHQMGAAQEAGDAAKAAGLSAKINAQYKEWAPLVPDVLGKNQIVDKVEAVENGRPIARLVTGTGEPIHNLDQMAEYIASKTAMMRLAESRAASLSPYMPGAVSQFGLRALKGNVAGWMTERSFARAEQARQAALSTAEADPARAASLIDEGMLTRILPETDDAVNAADGTVLAEKAAEEAAGLPSAERGALALTDAGKGMVQQNLRRTGSPLGDSKLGFADPRAIKARAYLATQRLTTLLPRNTQISIDSASSSEKIFKYAMLYMHRGDANALRSAFEMGDGGTRKAIVHGLVDQIGHAAGLGKTASGKVLLDSVKTQAEAYSTVGDEIMLDGGEKLALHPGQVRTDFFLPSFRDLHHAAAKFGAWDATMGRALTSPQADALMAQWKLGALFKPSTVTRNQLEGWLKTALDGGFGDALKSKAYLSAPNKELWARGARLESKAEYDALLAAGKTKEAKALADSTMLDGQLTGRSGVVQKVADFAPLAWVGRGYRAAFGLHMDQAHLDAADEFLKDDLHEGLEGYRQQIMESELGFKRAATQASDIAKAGFMPKTSSSFLKPVMEAVKNAGKRAPDKAAGARYKLADTEGEEGTDRFATALAQRVNKTPSVARAVLDRIEKPQDFTIDHVVQALDDPAIRQEVGLMGWGKYYWEDPDGAALKATSPEEELLGKQEWAQKIVNDYAYLFRGKNGAYQDKLANYVRTTGKAPDGKWIRQELAPEERPIGVLSPVVDAAPPNGKHGVTDIFNALQDVEGAAYQWMVERPLQRTTTAPNFWAHAIHNRVALNDTVDQLVGQGISREAAANLAKEVAIKNAWIKAEDQIDDPGLKSQFDVVARNIFPFSRATQAMIRRWGGALWRDPIKARKMMLAYEGAVQTGVVYNNAYGEPTFVYPGSGVMNGALRELAKVPGFGGFARFPVSASMTGGVLMSVPGADNPLRMAAGPMITVPMREIYNLLQNHGPFQDTFKEHRVLFDEIDSAINGPVGQGETFSQFVPTAARRFYQAKSTDDRNSALASSTIGAVANLAAAGMLPKPDATEADRQQFRSNVQTQVRSQLFLRAVFGLFAPAAPSQPSEGTSASQADYAFHVRGAGQLSDEYKAILNDVNGDLARANAIFTALHPDQVVYKDGVATTYKPVATAIESGHSQATASKVALPATQDALQWMTVNSDFIQKYGPVAAYFLPESAGNEPFSDQAYKTQIELGLRQRKTPQEFMDGLYVRNAENVFYPSVAGFDTRIQAAKNAGDSKMASQWTQAKSDWETQYKLMNPLLGTKLAGFADSRNTALQQIAMLHEMVNQGQVPDGQRDDLALMLKAYDNYTAYEQSHKGGGTANTQALSAARATLNQWATEKFGGTPLADLWDGVFRAVNSNLADLSGTNGGGS